jgi:ABC-type antimicrobial peptide transport system permease subunit
MLLSGVGLFGVLDYSVVQRRREIGIRVAVGAQVAHIAQRVTADVFRMLLVGSGTGLALGLTSVRFIEALLYQVRVGDWELLALPYFMVVAVALLASVPPVIRAIRVDPATILRSE